MGIYTDYGRFQKAREFKDYCNSGAGIWFAFALGSPRWDYLVTKNIQVPDSNNPNTTTSSVTDIPNVPPSAPAAYTPLYRWFASYKEGEAIDATDLKNDLLQPQEMSLIDRSYAIPSVNDTQSKQWPDNNQVESDAKDNKPDIYLEPTIATLNQSLIDGGSDPVDFGFNSDPKYSVDSNPWDPQPDVTDTWYKSPRDIALYPSPSIPAFPVTYIQDWKDAIQKAQEDLIIQGNPLYLFYQDGAEGPNDSWIEPNDSTKFESWAYMYHMSQTRTNSTTAGINENPKARPLGLYSFIQGQARFVEPIDEEDAGSSSIAAFKYGSHYWKIVKEDQINENNLPHHILLTVSVFPNELSDSSIVENKLPVRQVAVFKFPDCVLEQIPELIPETDGAPISRRFQVLKRDRFHIYRPGDTAPQIDKPHKNNPNDTENSPVWDSDNNKRQIYIPFNCDSVLNPNPVDENPSETYVHLRGTAEMLINDVMTARTKDVQQTDRYGYIIGF